MRTIIETAVEPLVEVLVDWSWRWAVLVALLAVALWIARPKRTAVQYLLCLAVLLAGLLLPLLPRWGNGFQLAKSAPAEPTLPLPEPLAVASPSTIPFAPIDTGPEPELHRAHVAEAPPAVVAAEPLERRHVLYLVAAVLWLLGVAVLVVRRVGGAWLLHRLRDSATPVAGPAAAVFASCRNELGLWRPVALATHAGVRSPIAFGLLRPIIVVPRDWSERPEDAQRGPLLHELAHLQRHDDVLNFVLELVRVVFFFHPLVLWLLARLERERELLCDETALAHGVDPRDYVRTLIAFAQVQGRFDLLSSSMPLRFGNRRTVKARITHLLEENMKPVTKPLPARLAWVFGALVLAVALGAGSFRVFALEAAGPEEANPQAAKDPDKVADAPKVAREALRYGGKSFDQWRQELLTELKPEIRVDGIKALTAFGINGYGPEATAAILETVKGYDFAPTSLDDQKVVQAGLDAVGRIGAPAVAALRDGLTSDNRNFRRFAALGLKEVGPAAKEAVPALLKAADDKDFIMRRQALRAIAAINPEAAGAQAAFVKGLKDDDPQVYITAIEGLQQLGPKAREAVPALLEAMHDKFPGHRHRVLDALNLIKPDLKEIIGPVMECFDKGDRQSFQSANTILVAYVREGKAGAAVAPLAAYVNKKDAKNPFATIALLQAMGPAAKDAVGALQEFMENTSEPNMQNAAKEALRKIRGQ